MSATWGGTFLPVLVTFDKPLAPEVGLPTAPWAANLSSFDQTINSVAASGNVATVGRTNGAMLPPPDRISYDGTDPLFRGIDGTPIAAFADFPVS